MIKPTSEKFIDESPVGQSDVSSLKEEKLNKLTEELRDTVTAEPI